MVPGVDLVVLSDGVTGDAPPAVVAPAGRTADRPQGRSAADEVDNRPELESGAEHGPQLAPGAELEQHYPGADRPAVCKVRRRRLSEGEGEDVRGWRPLFPLPLH